MEQIENQDAQTNDDSNVETQETEQLEANETDNDNSTRQSDGESGGDSLNDKLRELGISRKEYFSLKGQEDSQEGGEGGEKSNQQVVTSDDALLGRLEARGVMDVDDQDFVIKTAKVLGISAIDALNDEVVKTRLDANKKAREVQDATPNSSKRSGQTSAKESVDYWLNKDDSELPPKENKELRRKVIHARRESKKRKVMFNN